MNDATVKVGQVWADNDWRSEGRTLGVIRVYHGSAECVILTNRKRIHDALVGARIGPDSPRDMRGRTTLIRLDRFRPTSTGYRLVGDMPKVCPNCASHGKPLVIAHNTVCGNAWHKMPGTDGSAFPDLGGDA